MKDYIEITYRDIAKQLCAYLPIEDSEFIKAIDSYTEQIRKLPMPAKLALKSAYVFSFKVPHEERQDMFQELFTAILEQNTDSEKLAYTIARRDWQNWYRDYKLHSQFFAGSLNETITNAEGEETELVELLVGEAEFENRMVDKLDGNRLINQLPSDIKPLILKRLAGKPLGSPRKRSRGRPTNGDTLDNTERQRLNRWIKTEGYKLLLN